MLIETFIDIFGMTKADLTSKGLLEYLRHNGVYVKYYVEDVKLCSELSYFHYQKIVDYLAQFDDEKALKVLEVGGIVSYINEYEKRIVKVGQVFNDKIVKKITIFKLNLDTDGLYNSPRYNRVTQTASELKYFNTKAVNVNSTVWDDELYYVLDLR